VDRYVASPKIATLFDDLIAAMTLGDGLNAWTNFVRKEKAAYIKDPEARRELMRKLLFGMGSVTDIVMVPRPRTNTTRKQLEANVERAAEQLWAEIVKSGN